MTKLSPRQLETIKLHEVSKYTLKRYVKKFCSSSSISAEVFSCSNFWAPDAGSKRVYSCCRHKYYTAYISCSKHILLLANISKW